MEPTDSSLFLHPVHTSNGFEPIAVSKVSDYFVEGTCESGLRPFSPEKFIAVRLGWQSLLLQDDGLGISVAVALVLSKVALGQDAEDALPCIAVAPPRPATGVWLVLVPGDASRALDALGLRGAVRMDFSGRYAVGERPIGEGSMAKVYLARRRDEPADSSAEVIAKVTTVSRRNSNAGIPSDVQQEVSILTQVSHPNIVRFYGVFNVVTDDGRPDTTCAVVLLEYCAGGSLVGAVADGGAFHESRARPVLAGLMAALGHVHGCSVVHRDVKPDNVLLASDGRPVLADFGIACCVTDGAQLARRCGSPGYVAPELIRAQAYSFKVDCFAAGCLLYFLLSGRKPFQAETLKEIFEKTLCQELDLRKHLDRVSPQCKHFLQLLLKKKPTHRLTAEAALSHRWITQATDVGRPQDHAGATTERSFWKLGLRLASSASAATVQFDGLGPAEGGPEQKTSSRISYRARIKEFLAKQARSLRGHRSHKPMDSIDELGTQARNGARKGSKAESAKEESLASLSSESLSTATGTTWAFSRQTSPAESSASGGAGSAAGGWAAAGRPWGKISPE